MDSIPKIAKATIQRKRRYRNLPPNQIVQNRRNEMRKNDAINVSLPSSSLCRLLPTKSSTLLESNERMSKAEFRELRKLAILLPPHLRTTNIHCRLNPAKLVNNAAKYITQLTAILAAQSFSQLPPIPFHGTDGCSNRIQQKMLPLPNNGKRKIRKKINDVRQNGNLQKC